MDTERQNLMAQKIELQKQVDIRDKALKLAQIPLFRELILNEYMVNEVVRNVTISADPGLDAAQRADALAMAQAAGHLKRWLSAQRAMGNVAENHIASIEDNLKEMDEEDNQARIDGQVN